MLIPAAAVSFLVSFMYVHLGRLPVTVKRSAGEETETVGPDVDSLILKSRGSVVDPAPGEHF
jgi:hypothetical protein